MFCCFVEHLCFSQMLGFPQNVIFPEMSFCSLKCFDVFSKVIVLSEMSFFLFSVIVFCETRGFAQWRCVLGFFFYQALWNVVVCCLAWYIVVCSEMLLCFDPRGHHSFSHRVRAILGSFSFSKSRLLEWRMSCMQIVNPPQADLWYWPIWIKLTWT